MTTRPDDVVEDTYHVRVLTVHASKGAEATDVCCFDGITGKIAREMDRSEETRQNEARTWYVGLSRASERLHLMYDAFPGAIDHLPENLAPQAAASARQQASEAMTDGVLTTDDNGEECVDTASRRIGGHGESSTR